LLWVCACKVKVYDTPPFANYPKSRKSPVPVSLAASTAPPTIIRPISPMTNAVAANINKHSPRNRMASNRFQSILVSAQFLHARQTGGLFLDRPRRREAAGAHVGSGCPFHRYDAQSGVKVNVYD
jgi:hypothetical protein